MYLFSDMKIKPKSFLVLIDPPSLLPTPEPSVYLGYYLRLGRNIRGSSNLV